MSQRNWIPRAPALSGLFPENPEFQALENSDADWILSVLNVEGQVYAPIGHSGRLGFYRVHHGTETEFVKIVSEQESNTQRLAAHIQSHVSLNSGLAPDITSVSNIDGCMIILSKNLIGRILSPNDSCLHALGQRLEKLHVSLRALPDVERFRDLSRRRQKLLKVEYESLVLNPSERFDRIVRALQAIDKSKPFWTGEEPDAQILHGDLNPGNIYLSGATADILFTDFEDATVTYLPVYYDLAYVILRVIVPSTEKERSFEREAEEFLRGYCGENWKDKIHSDALVWWMWWICLRNLCLIEKLKRDGVLDGEVLQTESSKIDFLVDSMEESAKKLRKVFVR